MAISNPDAESVRGIPNFGNCCFMNVVIQCIVYVYAFNRRSLKDSHLPETLRRIYGSLTHPNIEVARGMAAALLTGVGLAPHQQHDAGEFFLLLLDKIRRQLCRPEAGNLILEPLAFGHEDRVSEEAWNRHVSSEGGAVDFDGQLLQTIACSGCGNKTRSSEIFSVLPVDPSSSSDILDMLKTYFRPENLEDFHCEACGDKKQCACRRLKIVRLPSCLVISINRFDENGSKRSGRVVFPELLDVACGGRTVQYVMQACIAHVGSRSECGHYLAYLRRDGKWLCVDDDTVTTVTQAPSDDAYIMFWCQVSF